MHPILTSVEICAGAGGQALGLELAGFSHSLLVEIDADACATLRLNRSNWTVLEGDVRELKGQKFAGVDLFAGGVPCPPFSMAGKQLGSLDERDLFPEALRLIEEAKPKAILLENVRGFASKRFEAYRNDLLERLQALGYSAEWRVLQASDYGVPQLRPRFILVGLRAPYAEFFHWPEPQKVAPTVSGVIADLINENGWKGTSEWIRRADQIAPTIVGGSKKHGGADLGPTRAKQAWAKLGVDGKGIANAAPDSELPNDGMPRLTLRMAARIQGFPDEWKFAGKKTSNYRQIGNAFPPPVAKAVGKSLAAALSQTCKKNDGFGTPRQLTMPPTR